MAKKSQLTTDISTDLASASNITASELRTFETKMLDNAYATVITDTQLTSNIATAVNVTTKKYNVKFAKQGRFVNITGTITKNSMGIVELEEWFSIENDEYFPANIETIWGQNLYTGAPIRFTLSTGGMFTLVTPLYSDETVSFKITYNTAE